MRADAYNFDLDTQWEILPIKGVVGLETVPLIGNKLMSIGWAVCRGNKRLESIIVLFVSPPHRYNLVPVTWDFIPG